MVLGQSEASVGRYATTLAARATPSLRSVARKRAPTNSKSIALLLWDAACGRHASALLARTPTASKLGAIPDVVEQHAAVFVDDGATRARAFHAHFRLQRNLVAQLIRGTQGRRQPPQLRTADVVLHVVTHGRLQRPAIGGAEACVDRSEPGIVGRRSGAVGVEYHDRRRGENAAADRLQRVGIDVA